MENPVIAKRARHRVVYVYVIHRGNFFDSCSKHAYVGAADAREAAREKIANMCSKLGIAKSYFTFEVLPLPLLSEKKRPAKLKSSGPY